MSSKVLNICLHNIVNKESEVSTIYDLTIRQLIDLEMTLEKLRNRGVFTSYELFFDDGYKSFAELTKKHNFKIPKKFIHTAIITDKIGAKGYMTADDVREVYNAGFSVCSHGVSHSALAIFEQDLLRPTPSSEVYRNTPYGKGRVLGSSEVKYQLAESSRVIELLIGEAPSAFVFPYGLYNEQTVFITSTSSSYAKLYTCDKAYDTGQFLSPRLLVTQENVEGIEAEILNLSSEYIPLTQQT